MMNSRIAIPMAPALRAITAKTAKMMNVMNLGNIDNTPSAKKIANTQKINAPIKLNMANLHLMLSEVQDCVALPE